MLLPNRKTTPPQFKETMSYKVWKNKLEMWQLVTSVPKNQQAIIVPLEALENNVKAEKAVDQITAAELNADTGMNTLLSKLDKVFQSETIDEVYNIYSCFIDFNRHDDTDMNDYIIEYEHIYKRMEDFDMKLPDAVLAFKLLDGANITEDDRKLALALGKEMKFNDMKSALKRLFNKISCTTVAPIKSEEAFYSKSRNKKTKQSYSTKSRPKLNPLDKHGKISRCVVCSQPCIGQINVHIAMTKELSCMLKKMKIVKTTSSEEINIVLMTEKIEKSEIFVAKASKSAVIDTPCTKTVAGKQWFDNFKANLTKHSLDEIQYFPSSTSFKFGDGRKVQSTMRVIFPAMLAGKYCKINAEIVDENIPLLLSKSSLRRCQTNINMGHDKATIFNKEIQLHQSTSGHYCIDILPKFEPQQPMSEVVLMLEAKLPSKKKSKQIDKIHKQLGHASIESMQNLFRNANLLDKNISESITETVTECQTCAKLKKPQSRPVVGLAKSNMFNGTVSVDLHQIKPN